MNNETKKLITHDGSFHADDIFAAATLSILLEREGTPFEIIRTRNEDLIKSGDYVFDVGLIHDESTNRFDHHQPGGAGKHTNGIEYASFGLVWKKFGERVAGTKEASDIIERKIVSPIDAGDNAIDLVSSVHEVKPYFLQSLFYSFRPSWKNANDEALLKGFMDSVVIAKGLLVREIGLANDYLEAEQSVLDCYNKSEDKRIVVLDKKYPWEGVLVKKDEPVYVVFPRVNGGLWGAEGVYKTFPSFDRRKSFPEAWGGLRDEELEKLTGVSGSVFCHRGRYMVVAKTREAAIKLAQIALESN